MESIGDNVLRKNIFDLFYFCVYVSDSVMSTSKQGVSSITVADCAQVILN